MAEKLLLKNLMRPEGVGSQNFRITGSCFNSNSHSITNCIDVASSDSAFSFYAPVDMYCLEISGNANTAYFQSVNEVEFANGQTGILSMTFGHAGSVPVSASTTNVITKGTRIYTEGIAGLSNATAADRHCHIRVGKGAFISGAFLNNNGNETTYYPYNQYDINTVNGPMTFSEAFYVDDIEVDYGDNQMKKKFKWRETTDSLPNNKLWFNATYKAAGLYKAPSPSATKRLTIPVGGKARIVTFLPNKRVSDGYQWAFVDYNNGQDYGYVRLNFNDSATLTRDGWSTELYLQATYQPFRVRKTLSFDANNKPNGGYDYIVQVGGKARISSFDGKQADGYQWARIPYGNTAGFAQMDTYQCYTIEYGDETDIM